MSALINANATTLTAIPRLRLPITDSENVRDSTIETLCALLERVEESRDFACLPRIRAILIQWQNQPPGGIVTELAKVAKQMGENG